MDGHHEAGRRATQLKQPLAAGDTAVWEET
jgi:hypothetical protein